MPRARHRAGTALGASGLLLAPAVAQAHGLGSAKGKSTLEFVPLGIEHMLLGFDHLLFILGCVLLAGAARPAAKVITLFIAGHSLTLLVATLAGWTVSDTAVDIVIALSVVFVGVVGLRGRPADMRPFYAAIFGFGLIHGLGLSTRLQFLGLPEQGEVARIIAFNIGLEIGQLVAIGVVVGLGTLLLRAIRTRREPLRRAAFAAVTVAGLAFAMVLSLQASKEAGEQAGVKAAAPRLEEAKATGACQEERGLLPPDGFGGGHPPKFFYAPSEQAPEEDLEHVIGDGYVIVRYRADAPEAEVAALRDWVGEGRNIVAAPRTGPVEAAKVTTAYRQLTCSELDVEAIKAFGEQWLADVRNGTAQS